jgi:hypothetical protein
MVKTGIIIRPFYGHRMFAAGKKYLYCNQDTVLTAVVPLIFWGKQDVHLSDKWQFLTPKRSEVAGVFFRNYHTE